MAFSACAAAIDPARVSCPPAIAGIAPTSTRTRRPRSVIIIYVCAKGSVQIPGLQSHLAHGIPALRYVDADGFASWSRWPGLDSLYAIVCCRRVLARCEVWCGPRRSDARQKRRLTPSISESSLAPRGPALRCASRVRQRQTFVAPWRPRQVSVACEHSCPVCQSWHNRRARQDWFWVIVGYRILSAHLNGGRWSFSSPPEPPAELNSRRVRFRCGRPFT